MAQDVPGSARASANATRGASAGAVVTGEAEADLTVPFTRSAIRSWGLGQSRWIPSQGLDAKGQGISCVDMCVD